MTVLCLAGLLGRKFQGETRDSSYLVNITGLDPALPQELVPLSVVRSVFGVSCQSLAISSDCTVGQLTRVNTPI
jgi:hypothetical protein